MSDLTQDEVRARAAAAGLPLRVEQLETVRRMLVDALAPLRRAESRAVPTLEPAVTFDAGSGEAHHGQ
jgi:hypothetical protein